MAGSEKRGVEAANADLFKNSVCILTKDNRTHTASFKKIEDLWKQLGAKVRILSASDHDDIVARVSHLPHLAAVALVNQIKQKDIDFISTGFKDTTRIAKSDPDIWKDIYVSNKKEIIDSLNKYIKFLERLRDRISTVDTKGLRQELKKVQDLRKKI
jgi:prephenate dehydrogenase